MKLSLIAALSANRVIGRGDKMPWHLPDDLQYFLDTTRGHPVLIGRTTYMAYKKVMRRHRMYVVTSQDSLPGDNITLVRTPEEGIALALQEGADELFVSGGSAVYAATIDKADRLYLTLIRQEVEGDKFFPEFDRDDWKEVSRVHHPADDRHAWPFDYLVLERGVKKS
jgi:dihydrofolate reductase